MRPYKLVRYSRYVCCPLLSSKKAQILSIDSYWHFNASLTTLLEKSEEYIRDRAISSYVSPIFCSILFNLLEDYKIQVLTVKSVATPNSILNVRTDARDFFFVKIASSQEQYFSLTTLRVTPSHSNTSPTFRSIHFLFFWWFREWHPMSRFVKFPMPLSI